MELLCQASENEAPTRRRSNRRKSLTTNFQRPKKEPSKGMQIKELNLENASDLYIQNNTKLSKFRPTPLETIYESPTKNQLIKGGMGGQKLKRLCGFTSIYKPSKLKSKLRKNKSKIFKKRGVIIPQGSTITNEQVEIMLNKISEDVDLNMSNNKIDTIVNDVSDKFKTTNVHPIGKVSMNSDANMVNGNRINVIQRLQSDIAPLTMFEDDEKDMPKKKKYRRRSGISKPIISYQYHSPDSDLSESLSPVTTSSPEPKSICPISLFEQLDLNCSSLKTCKRSRRRSARLSISKMASYGSLWLNEEKNTNSPRTEAGNLSNCHPLSNEENQVARDSNVQRMETSSFAAENSSNECDITPSIPFTYKQYFDTLELPYCSENQPSYDSTELSQNR